MWRLPLHPRPLPEEALSSWLTRLAGAYRLTPETFIETGLGLPAPAGHLGALDADPSPGLIECLSERTGVCLDRIRATTLLGYGELLLGAAPSSRSASGERFKDYVLQFPSLTPPSPRASALLGSGPEWRAWVCADLLGFSPRACRRCLAGGPVPYVRIAWRAGWMVSCPLHDEMLDPVILLPDPVRVHGFEPPRAVPPQILALDRKTHEAVTTGSVVAPCGERVHAGVWLRALRGLLDELVRPSNQLRVGAYPAVRRLWRLLDREFHEGLGRLQPFEDLTAERRELAMTVTALAVEHLGSGLVAPKGDPARSVFRPPRPVDGPDLISPRFPERLWRPFGFAERIANARLNSYEAFNLRQLLRIRTTLPDRVEIDAYFAAVGVAIVRWPPEAYNLAA